MKKKKQKKTSVTGNIPGLRASEGMAVLREELQVVVDRELAKISRDHDNNFESEIHGFAQRMGFASADTYWSWASRNKQWVAMNTADRIVTGLGRPHAFCNGEITIYKVVKGKAEPLAFDKRVW